MSSRVCVCLWDLFLFLLAKKACAVAIEVPVILLSAYIDSCVRSNYSLFSGGFLEPGQTFPSILAQFSLVVRLSFWPGNFLSNCTHGKRKVMFFWVHLNGCISSFV